MSFADFSGQWVNREESGFVRGIIDLDYVDGISEGHAYWFPSDASPSLFSRFEIRSEEQEFEVRFASQPFDPRKGRFLNDMESDNFYGTGKRLGEAMVKFCRISETSLSIASIDGREPDLSFVFELCQMPDTSSITPEPKITSWREFRDNVAISDFRKWVFRGQSKPYPLQTTFHRSARKDLIKYLYEDVPLLNHSISGRVRHLFDINNPRDFGALLNLAQHHGFPTPLLDWSYSPFVAAWFAFKDLTETDIKQRGSEACVRIFALDRKQFIRVGMFSNLTLSLPHTSLLDALPIENDRAIPQQGVLMLTNLQDIENHVRILEEATEKKFLKAYDLPVSEVHAALRELSSMGISRSTMMPGIESTCLDLRQQLF